MDASSKASPQHPQPEPTTLAAALRALPEQDLLTLLRDRADLASPVPEGFAALAARASAPGSVRRALGSLTLPELQVLEALVVLHGAVPRPTGVAPAALAAAVGLDDLGALSPLLDRLRTLALIWGTESLHPVRTLREQITSPAGLAPVTEADPAPDDAEALLAEAPEELHPAFAALAWGPARVEGTGPLAQALRDSGIVVPADGGALRIPRSIHLALRGAQVHRELALDAPQPESAPVTERFRGSRSAAAAEAAQRSVQILDSLRLWPADPPPVLRRGGLPQRDLRRLAAAEDATLTAYAAIMHTAWWRGWIQAGEMEWMSMRDAEAQRARPTEERWAELVRAWLALPHVPSLVGTPGHGEQPRALLSDDLRRRGASGRRRRALAQLAAADGERIGARPLAEAMRWHFPMVPAEVLQEEVDAALAEGETLGLVADEALTVLGLALLREDSTSGEDGGASAALGALLPPVVDEVIVAGDLTVTIPGRPSPRLLALEDWGTVLSRGPATTLRLDARTLQAGFEAGGDLDALLEVLAAASRTPLPQGLDAAAADARRRHGQVRVGRVASVITASEDVIERLVGVLSAEPGVQVRRLAPTVLAASEPPSAIAALVKAAGLSPQEVGIDGAPVRGGDRASHRLRAQARAAAREAELAEETGLTATPEEAADLIRRADGASGPGGVIGRLQAAIDAGETLRIGIVDGRGGVQALRALPLQLTGGQLRARRASGAGSGEEFTVAVHRVTLG